MAPKTRATGWIGSRYVGVPAALGSRTKAAAAKPLPAPTDIYDPTTNPGGQTLPAQGPWEIAMPVGPGRENPPMYQWPGLIGGGTAPGAVQLPTKPFLPAGPYPGVPLEAAGVGPGAAMGGAFGLPQPVGALGGMVGGGLGSGAKAGAIAGGPMSLGQLYSAGTKKRRR